jgi:hypothetical protein
VIIDDGITKERKIYSAFSFRDSVKKILSTLLAPLFLFCTPLVNKLAFFPDNIPADENLSLPKGCETVLVTTSDGETLHCLWVESQPEAGVVIYFHGNAGHIYDRASTLLKLSEFGWSVLGVSYRGYGKSTGSPSEKGIYRDAQAALNYAQQELNTPLSRIVIYGRSIGSAAAVDVCQNNSPAGLILITPLTSGKAMAKEMGLGALAGLAGESFDNRGKLKHIEPPLLIIHGTDDDVVPYSMGKKLYARYSGPKTFVTIEKGRHNSLEFDNPQKYWGAVQTFLRAVTTE